MAAAPSLGKNAQAFGKYQLLKKLATGGMAEVWLARQTGIEGFQRLLVVKRILPHLAEDPEFVQMFLNEAKIAARFSHPNVAQIFDLGEMNGSYFIAMEFIQGEDLGRVMRKAWSSGQWIARPLSIRIIASACEGLHYAHTRTDEEGRPLRVVHRDISPQNILISFDGSVKLVDFGIAKAAGQASMTRSGAIKGKFAYMSPEQAAGKPLDNRSDVYSIGLVLYELLTGVRPLKRDTELATLQAALESGIEPPSKVADVPEDMDAVVMRALSKAPDDRYRDARSFQMALEEVLVGQRWVASSVQLSELMHTLFAERLAEEAKLGHPAPATHDSSSANPLPELPGSRTDSLRVRTEPASSKSEISWDAPPGEADVKERPRARVQPRTLSRSASKVVRDEPAAPPPPETPSWTAPPSGEQPVGRKPSGEHSLRLKRRPAEPTLIGPAPEQDPEPVSEPEASEPPEPEPDPQAPDSPEPSRSGKRGPKFVIPSSAEGAALREGSASARRRSPPTRLPQMDPVPTMMPPRREAEPEETDDEQQFTPVRHTPPRRFPEAPPPSVSVPKLVSEPQEAVTGFAQVGARFKTQLAIGAGVMVLILTLWAIHGATKNSKAVGPNGEQAIFLTAECNLPVHVSVRHHPGESVGDPVAELGEVPLRHVAGVHVRDTIIFKLEAQDVYYETEIPYGEPGEDRTIRKEFKRGHYELNLSPPTLRNISVRLNAPNGPLVGTYPPAKVELIEGTHRLVLEGPQLAKPAEIQVEVRAGETVHGKPYDLTQVMREPPRPDAAF